MQNLAQEIQENILLSLSDPKDLFQACSVNRNSRNICSGSAFWREKFARENLPLLQKGYNFSSWSSIYNHAYHAALEADEVIASRRQTEIRLIDVSHLENLGIPLSPDVQEAWLKMREEDNSSTAYYENQYYKTTDDLYLVFKPFAEKEYTMEIINFQTIDDNGTEYVHQFPVSVAQIPIFSAQETWNIIYRKIFFGYTY